MNAVEVPDVARAAGLSLAVDGSEIVLKSVGPPPPAILNLLRIHKAEIVSAITAVNTGGRAIGAAEVAAHETCGSAAIGPLPVCCDCALPIAERLETWWGSERCHRACGEAAWRRETRNWPSYS